MHRMVDTHLRCYWSYHPDDWDDLIPSAEFSNNSSIGDDLGMFPFEVDMGYVPRTVLDMISGKSI